MMMEGKKTKIVIAEDQQIFRSGFKKIMESVSPADFEFIADAENGIDLVEKVQEHQPDIVITDIKMPEMSGIEACRIIKKKYPQTSVIAFSIFDNEEYIHEMINAGASGYLVKTGSIEEVLEAIHSVTEGTPYYCSGISEKLFFGAAGKRMGGLTKKKVHFTLQEIKVINLICKQDTTKEIADKLGLSIRTVENYRHNIQEKIGAKNMVGIAMYALLHDVVKMED